MGKIQTISYKCCGKIFAACHEPHFIEDKDWIEAAIEYKKEGHIIKNVPSSTKIKFGTCECNSSMEIEDPNQLKLFDL